MWSVSGQSGGDRSLSLTNAEPVIVAAGTTDVVLELRPGAEIRGEVIGTVSASIPPCEVTLLSADGVLRGSISSLDGKLTLVRLPPGAYFITASTVDGRFGVSQRLELALGEHLDGVRIELRAGATLELHGPVGIEIAEGRLWSSGVPIGFVVLERSEVLPVTVPPGECELRWRTSDQPEVERKSVITLAVGETREFELAPEK
jgi:hypothetical protein